jgi:hypothetical protein
MNGAMRSALLWLGLFTSSVLAGACGGSKPAEAPVAETKAASPEAAESAPGADAAKPEAAEATKAGGVPTKCFKSGATCSPDPQFVKRICNGKYPSLGLYLFSNPAWTRGYLTRRTQAWNASGGASDSGWVEFDEEVLILYARVADAGGMQVSGAGGSYDALRWDGSCITLQSEEVSMSKAPAPKYPAIDFRYLDDDTQEALRKDDKINKAWQTRRQECKGATSGDVSLKCVKADDNLTKTVIAYIRGGGSIPEPKKLP